MNNLLNRPYDLLERKRFRHIFVFGGSVFGMIFLWVFEPFGFYNLTNYEKLYAIGFYFVAGLIPLILQFYVFQDVVLKKYTLLNTVLWIVLSSVLLVVSGGIVNSILFNDGAYVIERFLFFLWVIPTIQVIPITVFILIHYNINLNKRLKIAMQVNNRLKPGACENTNNEKIVILNSNNKKEKTTVLLDSLLYVTSVDNYIEIHIIENNKVERKLLRYSLMNLKQDNSELKELFRCLKSFIVNKKKIESLVGNASGYKIKISYCDAIIPVSRKYNKVIHAIITE